MRAQHSNSHRDSHRDSHLHRRFRIPFAGLVVRAVVRLVVCAVAVLAVLPSAATAQRISNPDLYAKSFKAAQEALDHFGAWDDPEELRRVSEIVYRLVERSNYDEFPVSVYLIDMPEPNAFALPGGHVFVTRGMLALELDDDMLANLLGHELAHVIHRHGTKMQKRATLLNILSQLLLAGVVIGADNDSSRRRDGVYHPYDSGGSRKGSLIQGAAATGMVISELLLRDYSREFEDEADVEGQRLAAAAGYDPDGARALWERMTSRIPQSNQYGYWRTHPFSDVRMRAGEVRARELTIMERGAPPEAYRKKVQELILGFAEDPPYKKADPDLDRFYQLSALLAWPQGDAAERIRLATLETRRDAELEKSELDRDYGALRKLYARERDEVAVLTPESEFLAALDKEIAALDKAAAELYPKAVEVWEEGIYQVPFLEAFLSNYPDAEIAPQVALALGDSYSRMQRPADAVEEYLTAWEAGPATPAGQRALAGLRNLAPRLEDLTALERLASDDDEEVVREQDLREAAEARLREMAGKYSDIANGGTYLRNFPDGLVATEVRKRLEALAGNLYGEVVLYQDLGDHIKALERIQKILTYAPDTNAAELLRDRAVLDG